MEDGEEEGIVLQNKITQEEFREMLAEAIIKHNLPLDRKRSCRERVCQYV